MKLLLDRFYRFIDGPIDTRARLVLAMLVIPLLLSFYWPLWTIQLAAPQYPDGLEMYIYLYKVEGGNNGQHLQEINILNHYIGMRPIQRDTLKDLDWMPFAVGILVLFTLRVAAIGDIRSLIDLSVLILYFSLFSLGRFLYQMYRFGHDLDPTAPIKVEPFMPAIIGNKQIANFSTASWPQLGTLLFATFVLGVLAITVGHLIAGRLAALRQAKAESVRRAASSL
jgi:hypothetical protein